jgi:hypothetical protein
MKQKFHVGQKVLIARKADYTGSKDYAVWEDELDKTLGKTGIVVNAIIQDRINQWIYSVNTIQDEWWYLGESLELPNNSIKYLL